MSIQAEQNLYADQHGRMVCIQSEEAGIVSFSSQGGGFLQRLRSEEFHRHFKPCDFPPFRQVSVAIDGVGDEHTTFVAYSNGRRWNGWAMPHFPLDSALAVAKAMGDVRYDETRDVFILEPEGEEPEEFAAEVIQVDGNDVKVYAIGSGYWCWDVVDDVQQAPAMRP